jgi:DNA-binding response OmpR family regulator
MASRVLIVEDEPDIRDLLTFHLERDGFQVARARKRSTRSASPGRIS